MDLAQSLMLAAVALEDDPIDALLLESDSEESDSELLAEDDIADLLDLTALNWTEIALSMTGDGSRGSYDQIPKSVDFFSVCLQAPDREFRHMFRFG